MSDQRAGIDPGGSADPGHGFDEILADVPGAAELQMLLDEIWRGALDPVTVELCRLRIAQLLASPNDVMRRSPEADIDEELVAALARWSTDPAFDARRRAALRFTEAYVVDARSITDDDRRVVLDALSEPEAVALTTALATFEALTRTRLALEAT